MSALDLPAEFPPVPVEQWEEAIRKDLKGADYDKRLLWRTEEGVALRPYATSRDLEPLDGWLRTAPGEYPFVRGSGHAWQPVEAGLEPRADILADAWHNRGATAVEEIAYMLAAGAEMLEAAGVDVAPKLVCRFAVGSQFFVEIAKLRAARLTWAQVVEAFGGNRDTACLRIHAVTATANKTLYDAGNNLLRASAEALAAVIGGCDWLTVIPFRFDDHLARNIPRILREEAYLDRVADPAGGAYAIEVLTDQLAREAWKVFQQVEAAGGFAIYRDSGALDRAINASRARKEKATAERRRVLVGTNAYPNLADRTDAELPATLQTWRVAGLFERLRRRTERHERRTGRVPLVLLLESGDEKMRRARSGFCAGFFSCAGFETVTRRELEPADLVVLCSADAEYGELAARIVPLTDRPVIVAGYPKDQVEALQAAGVAGFVYLGSNAVEALEQWQNRLGMGD